jgi:hypothetical protein
VGNKSRSLTAIAAIVDLVSPSLLFFVFSIDQIHST